MSLRNGSFANSSAETRSLSFEKASNVPVVWPGSGVKVAARGLPHGLNLLFRLFFGQFVIGAVSAAFHNFLRHFVLVGHLCRLYVLGIDDRDFAVHGSVMGNPYADVFGTLAHFVQGAVNEMLDEVPC